MVIHAAVSRRRRGWYRRYMLSAVGGNFWSFIRDSGIRRLCPVVNVIKSQSVTERFI